MAASLPPKTTVRPSQSPFTGLCRPLVFLRALTEVKHGAALVQSFGPTQRQLRPAQPGHFHLTGGLSSALAAYSFLHTLREHHLPAPLCSGTPLERALTAQIIHKH